MSSKSCLFLAGQKMRSLQQRLRGQGQSCWQFVDNGGIVCNFMPKQGYVMPSSSRVYFVLQCAACYSEYTAGEMPALPCGHRFCKDCWQCYTTEGLNVCVLRVNGVFELLSFYSPYRMRFLICRWGCLASSSAVCRTVARRLSVQNFFVKFSSPARRSATISS